MGELVVRLVFSLAVVLGLLLLIAKFAGRRFQGRKDAVVQVVHRQQLSRNAAISVVHVGGRVLVLGTTDQEVRLLTELDPEPATEPATEPVPELESVPPADGPTAADDELTDSEIAVLTAPPAPAEPAVPAMTSESLAELLSAVATESTPTAPPAPPTPLAPYVGRRIARPVEPLVTAPVAAPLAAPVISPAAELLAFEIVAERRTEPTLPTAVPAAVPTALAVKPPSKAALRAATRRLDKQLQTQLAERAAGASVPLDDGRLAGSVLSGQTWKQAWHAVRGQAS